MPAAIINQWSERASFGDEEGREPSESVEEGRTYSERRRKGRSEGEIYKNYSKEKDRIS